MSIYFTLKNDVNLISLNKLFTTHTYINILDDLYRYNLLDGDITGDVKRIIYHHTIFDICNNYIESPQHRPILYYNYTQLDDCPLTNFISESDLLSILNSICYKLEKYLPIRIYKSTYSVENIQYKIEKDDGRAIITLNHLSDIKYKNLQPTSFKDIKKFAEKFGLNYLNSEFFDKLSTKQMFFK